MVVAHTHKEIVEAEGEFPTSSGPTTEGRLLVVGTPIGNLDDASPRCLATLRMADVVLAEDTRVTSRLLARFDLHPSLVRCDENVMSERIPQVLSRLDAGETVAFVSDAGMPCISDPGQRLVDAVLEAGMRVEVVPGPSAVTSALAVSGLRCDRFLFCGFPSRKAQALREELAGFAILRAALVFFESPRRVRDTLEALAEVMPTRRVALARELTKMHEEVLRGTAADVLVQLATPAGVQGAGLSASYQVRPYSALAPAGVQGAGLSAPAGVQGTGLSAPAGVRGECVIVVEQPTDAELTFAAREQVAEVPLDEAICAGLAAGESKTALAKRLARERGLSRRDVYDQVVACGKRRV